ncbi:MAG TPA: GntR family transcriptional regulator, partial [Gemmatimonadota bacterium]|nr:GntR family transcriptional regulator [Gemmatimonadota bacterium]
NGTSDGAGNRTSDGSGNGRGGIAGPAGGPSGQIRLHRIPLREQIRSILRDWLVLGEFEPGEDLNERAIGERLGSSRTPVREALLLLAVEGLVSVHPSDGYYVARLTREEGEDLYGLLGLVERRALHRAGVPSEETLERLASLDRERAEADDPVRRLELDRRWHEALLPPRDIGRVYADEIVRLKNRAARYELDFLGDDEDQEGALGEHRAILDALGSGDLEAAAGLLEEHWLHGASYAARWPAAREDGRRDGDASSRAETAAAG